MYLNDMTDLVADKRPNKTTFSWFKMGDEDEVIQSKHGSKIRWLKLSQKAIYVLVLFILTLVLLMQIWNCLEHFYEEPTYVETRVAPQHKAMFPAMTICKEGGYKEENFQKHGIATKKGYNDARNNNVTWSSNNASLTDQELFKDVTYEFDEIVKRIYVRFIRQNKTNGETKISNLQDDIEGSVKEQRHRSFGRCYTFHPRREIRDQGVYYIKYWFHVNVKIYFHGPDQFLDLSGRMGYKLYLGEIMQSQITVTDITILERNQKKDKDDPTYKEGRKTCMKENYDDCIYNMLAREMRKNTEDNCTVPYVRDDSKICSKEKDKNTTFWIAWNRVTNQQLDCNIPCHSLTVNLGAKNYQNKTVAEQDYGLLYLYYAPRVTQSEEHLLYTLLNLFAEIGGYVGLILGYSLFHVAALISSAIETKVKRMEAENELRRERKAYNSSTDRRGSSWSDDLKKTNYINRPI